MWQKKKNKGKTGKRTYELSISYFIQKTNNKCECPFLKDIMQTNSENIDSIQFK